MKLSESPIIHFVRGTTLLATLLAVPGIAVCWNHLPKDIRWNNFLKNIWNQAEPILYPKNFGVSAAGASLFASESDIPALPEFAASPPESELVLSSPILQPVPLQETSVQRVSWERQTLDMPLEHRLEALGVTHYRIEKWGDRGELIRFSCTVTPSGPYAYKKFFHGVGVNAETVTQSVIADIERWKSEN